MGDSVESSVLVFSGTHYPSQEYITIGDILVKGGDYAFRLKRTILVAKKAGGEGVIVRGDKLDVNFKSNAMASLVIRFVLTEKENEKKEEGPAPKAKEEKYFDMDDYFLGSE